MLANTIGPSLIRCAVSLVAMIALYRHLAGMRCPSCHVPQPVMNLRMTYAGGFSSIALHKHVACTACFSRLRLIPRHGGPETWGLRILLGLLQFAMTVVVFLLCMMPFVLVFGIWGLLGLPLYVVVSTYAAAWFWGQTWPWLLEITTTDPKDLP